MNALPGAANEMRSLHKGFSKVDERPLHTTQAACTVRSGSFGSCNFIKAWYIFVLHIAVSILLLVGIIGVDNKDFRIGNNDSIFAAGTPLYQAQATGLISLGLVIVRIIGAAASALLTWRIVFVLLEKRGLTLGELTRMTSWRVIFLPTASKRTSLLWSLWALLAIIFLWPQTVASPLASSAVSWIPGTTVRDIIRSTSVEAVDAQSNWDLMAYVGYRMAMVINGAESTAKDPDYAFKGFDTSKVPSRRLFNSTEEEDQLREGSRISLGLPYFDVEVKWVNASAYDESGAVYMPEFTDVNQDNNVQVRTNGQITVVRHTPWSEAWAQDLENGDVPRRSRFNGTKFIGVKLSTFTINDTLSDGTTVTNETECQTITSDFGKIPDVEQWRIEQFADNELAAVDCWITGIASVNAGLYEAQDCNVTSADKGLNYATCSLDKTDNASLKEDWLTDLSLDFMSEVLKYSVILNNTSPWIDNDLTSYSEGMLRLGYHAAWNGLMIVLNNHTEEVNYRPAESVVFASIERTKLYAWLGMNITLAVSGMLVLIACYTSRIKTIRNPDLAALTIDLTNVSHSGRANGLCNAVALGRADEKLPMLRWASDIQGGESDSSCRRALVFAEDHNERGLVHLQDER